MRRKKHKHTRKAMSFYKINYGFHEPYKVLLDGNFIHATGQTNLSDLNTHLPKLLGGRCKLYTTKCIGCELRKMGAEFAQSVQAARSHMLHKCEHPDGPVGPSECLKAQIGTRNEGHWLIASQDATLRAHLAKLPGVPLLFASVNGLHLETPAELVKQRAGKSEAGAAVPAHELASAALRELPALAREAAHAAGRGSGSALVQFRRQSKAKGPNPLAVRKAVKKKQAPQQQSGKGKAAAAGPSCGEGPAAGGAGKAKRKRARGGATADEAGGDDSS